MRRRQQQYLKASQSPLMCSLAIIIQGQYPIIMSVTEGQMGTYHRGIAAAYVVLRMSLSSIIKQPTAGTLSWRFIKLASRRVCQGNAVAAFIIRLMVAGLCHLPGSSSLGASRGLLPSWNALLEIWPCCARACMSCSCCEITVCSNTLASAATLTCNLWIQLFADWRVLLSWALMRPSSGTVCCIRVQTSSIFCWVSWSFVA